jgi:hypothetical protein
LAFARFFGRPSGSTGQFEGAAALPVSAGVAIPLVAGLVLAQSSISAFGAVGAMSVGFRSFQGVAAAARR